jgi:Fe-S-cluster containining protein
MTNRSFDDDPKEIKRLIIAMKNKQGELGIKIPMTCRHLENNDEGIFACTINDTKPVVCQEYFCEKVIKTALEKEMSNGICVQ